MGSAVSTFIAWFMAAVGPLAGRVMASLGFAAVTTVGAQASVDYLLGQVVANLSAGPAAALQLAGLAGAWEALSIFTAAIAFCVSWHLLTGASRYVLNPAGPAA